MSALVLALEAQRLYVGDSNELQTRFIASKTLKLKGRRTMALQVTQPSSVFLVAQMIVCSTLYVIIEHIPRPWENNKHCSGVS